MIFISFSTFGANLYRLQLWTSKVFLFKNGLGLPLIADQYLSQQLDECIFPLYSEIGYITFHPRLHIMFISHFPNKELQLFYVNKQFY